jgi:hypothetical protein
VNCAGRVLGAQLRKEFGLRLAHASATFANGRDDDFLYGPTAAELVSLRVFNPNYLRQVPRSTSLRLQDEDPRCLAASAVAITLDSVALEKGLLLTCG